MSRCNISPSLVAILAKSVSFHISSTAVLC